ncbi:tRNA threonylcarbamoyladenosine modification protein TsaB [Candidatus Phytoplasma solani]|uniref:tRNA (adenosine(37)-N6)-threonylcarbamoyltransferase complex dimerization subunit type 1 TsaB n=1 Tax=Candidatus Phytoplasma solani TaxID=69896 RepID=UPI0032DB41DD
MTQKNILILDTSTKSQIVIFSRNHQIKTLQQKLFCKDYVATIIPLIDKVLQANKVTLKEIDTLIVGVGPGSYTGSRVAVLTAKMLSLSLQVPLYRISSLLLLSSGYDFSSLTPLIDARNNSSFALSLKNNQICLKEDRYELPFLQTFPNHLLITPETIKISLPCVYQLMTKVSNPHLLVPNYLLQTQAQRNLKKDNS